ncbi:PREDICTED: putative G3BP-like protein [Ipomoea nil]|uniref:putative G3BP-like protein n=1 Tax=Ipomoea nil TaxID=35883 RepID=UPI000901CF23|nr:PREDICTED: putative G3BP-like protein [Ipomoea nil]
MAGTLSTETVGKVFSQQYYTILRIKPEESYKFYENSSVATWDDAKDSVTTLDGICEMIMASNFKGCPVEVKDVHSQDSLQGSILVVVTGLATWKDNSRRKFSQTFVLAKHSTGFFVMNDILRFFDDKEPKSPLVADSEPAQESVDISIQVEESSTDADGKSASADSIDVKVTVEEVAETRPKQTVSEVVSDVKDPAPKSSYLEMLSKGKTSSTPAPTTRFVRVSAFDDLSGQEKAKPLAAAQKGSPKAMSVAASTADNVTKDEAPPTPTKTAAETIRAPKGIYVGGLPPNTTVNDLTDAVKKFGRVRNVEGVQVVVLEDKYCYGFVHFQSADSAKKAVEAQGITVKGKEAYISYKRLGRNNARAAANGNDNRGRSPSGRSKPNSRAPSCNGHSSNGETHHSGANQHNNNNNENGHKSLDGSGGEADGWIEPRRRRRRGRDQRSNGEALRDHTSGTAATSQQ